MSIRITHIRLSDGVRDHEHITDVQWTSLEDNDHGVSPRAAVVKWIDTEGGHAYVGQGPSSVRVTTVHPAFGAAHLRTWADGAWTDNLLELQEF
ncbi:MULTISPECIES: DUF3892 domain-containing protein [unclassified Cellulomonas]|uniref:DUF3892 domain-containing protein n=1 Tax=unclassified Cellulomonas TaxID=2620175 RepID=UPI00199B21C7|nr:MULTISPECIES: DUF3892 domain-containing protein [unclassified Cellulomonas]MBD3777836.1 DUF3892 domain-containing protein [Micrococcales bacterium]QZN85808.1 DUF3892 domain-containing protein [Cellulomonas sp. C5510]WHP15996.1 DUF3892 domain-containing protein [Cellulomonas sp. ES6]